MRVVIVTNILAPYRIPLLEAIRERVDELAVVLMAHQHEDRQWELASYSFKTVFLRGVHNRPAGHHSSLHWNFGVIKTLRSLNPDVVISGGFALANISAFLYCKVFRRKYIGWGEITLRDGAQSSFIRRIIRRILTSWSDASIASSSDSRDAFVYYGAKYDDVLLSVMPIDVEMFHRTAEQFRNSKEWKSLRDNYGSPILLSIGRLISVKGYNELFKIYECILAHFPSAALIIMGDGAEKNAYEEFVRIKGWKGVHFGGFAQSNDLCRYLAIADIFVFHTLYDPFGAVLSEAMASELPVVSSIYASATRDLIVDTVTGYAIDPLNTEASCAAVLEVLKMAPPAKVEMVRAAYEKIKQYNFTGTADAIVRFAERIAQKK